MRGILLAVTLIVVVAFIVLPFEGGNRTYKEITGKEMAEYLKVILVVVGILAGAGIGFHFVYNVWPRHNLYFTELQEGYAVVITRKRAVRKIHIRLINHKIDSDYNVIPLSKEEIAQKEKRLVDLVRKKYAKKFRRSLEKELLPQMKEEAEERAEQEIERLEDGVGWRQRRGIRERAKRAAERQASRQARERADIQIDEMMDDLKKGIKDEPFFGGLVFFWWPLDDVYRYELSWTSPEHDGTLTEHKNEELKRVLLMKKEYYFKVDKPEDADLMPLEVDGYLWIVVRNPYRALFVIHNYVSSTLNLMSAAVRNALTQDSYEQLTKKMLDISNKIMMSIRVLTQEDVGAEGAEAKGITIKDVLLGFGVEATELAIRRIDPADEEDRKSTLEPMKQKYKKEADVIKAEAKKAVDIINAEAGAKVRDIESKIEMVAKGREVAGTYGEMRQMLVEKGVPEEEVDKLCENLRITDMELVAEALKEYRFPGQDGVKKSVFDWTALVGDVIGQVASAVKDGSSQKPEKTTQREDNQQKTTTEGGGGESTKGRAKFRASTSSREQAIEGLKNHWQNRINEKEKNK